MSKINVLLICTFFSLMPMGWGAVIKTQPQDVVARLGEKAVFTISTSQDSGVSYQWYVNDSLAPIATVAQIFFFLKNVLTRKETLLSLVMYFCIS